MAFPHKREKIAGIVRRWIDDGKYQPGDRFPSDQELARKFKVTHITVRSALQPLVEVGVLERRIGFGTIVRKPKPKDTAEAPTAGLSMAVGVTIPETTVSFFNDVVRGIESALFSSGRPFLLGHTWEIGDREETLVRAWVKQGLGRLLLVPIVGSVAASSCMTHCAARRPRSPPFRSSVRFTCRVPPATRGLPFVSPAACPPLPAGPSLLGRPGSPTAPL